MKIEDCPCSKECICYPVCKNRIQVSYYNLAINCEQFKQYINSVDHMTKGSFFKLLELLEPVDKIFDIKDTS